MSVVIHNSMIFFFPVFLCFFAKFTVCYMSILMALRFTPSISPTLFLGKMMRNKMYKVLDRLFKLNELHLCCWFDFSVIVYFERN